MIVVDTSLLYAVVAAHDRHHPDAVTWYGALSDRLTTTPLVLAELDHLIERRGGFSATSAFRRDVAAGAYDIEWWPSAGRECVEIAERYSDLGLSLADASLVALAARVDTTQIATFDERHFRAVIPLAGGTAFTLLPADWQA